MAGFLLAKPTRSWELSDEAFLPGDIPEFGENQRQSSSFTYSFYLPRPHDLCAPCSFQLIVNTLAKLGNTLTMKARQLLNTRQSKPGASS